MQEVIEIIRQHWGIILTLAGLLASLFWLKMDSRYAKKDSLNHLNAKVVNIENELRHLPSSNDVQNLRVALVEMKGETKELRTETKMLRHLVELLTEKEVKKE